MDCVPLPRWRSAHGAWLLAPWTVCNVCCWVRTNHDQLPRRLPFLSGAFRLRFCIITFLGLWSGIAIWAKELQKLIINFSVCYPDTKYYPRNFLIRESALRIEINITSMEIWCPLLSVQIVLNDWEVTCSKKYGNDVLTILWHLRTSIVSINMCSWVLYLQSY